MEQKVRSGMSPEAYAAMCLRMSDMRRGRRASPATIEKLKAAWKKRPRGSIRQKWADILLMCMQHGAKLERTRNYWTIIDKGGQRHRFTTADDAIAYLGALNVGAPVENYAAQIKELCNQTGYSSKIDGQHIFLYDKYKMRIYDSTSPRSVIDFLVYMRDWMQKEKLIKKPNH